MPSGLSRDPALEPRPSRSRMRRAAGWLLKGALLLVLLAAGLFTALYARYRQIVDPGPRPWTTAHVPGERGRWVNPFLGTGGFPWVCGQNFPGSMVPFGMVRLGPETRSLLLGRRALNTSGYHYADPEIIGFSHTRLNGTGATEGGHFLITPTVRPLPAGPLTRSFRPALPFSHAEERAAPGYYAVRLPDPGVLVELTATSRVGVHRYSFDSPLPPHLLVDVMNALGGRPSRDGHVRVLAGAGEVEGTVRTFGTFAQRYGGLRVHFVARTEPPFTSFATWDDAGVSPGRVEAQGQRVGVDLGFGPALPPGSPEVSPRPVTLRLAISHVSVANARRNLEAEVGATGLDTVADAARQAWEDRLSSVTLHGGSDEQRRIFTTALYRVFQMPTVFNDVHGEYLGFDGGIHRVTEGRQFTDLSLWDTFRTTHPLYTLLAPGDHREMLASLVRILEQGGWLPRWPAGAGYSNSMLGTPADIVLAEAYLKGIRGFDVEKAYEAMKRTASMPTPPGAAFSGRQGIEHYLAFHYCPRGLVRQSVSRTFEYGWSDDAISRLASALGHGEDHTRFAEQSRYYRNLWNPETQYFQPRHPDGRFYDGFRPLLLTYLDRTGERTRDYVEGSALQWRWGAPYDAEGMISLFKSPQDFVRELESFFEQSSPARGAWNPGPYYWHGNQPDLHAAYLFNAAGRSDLTRKWVRWILAHKYGTGHDGLDGNDDGGTLSAWYVLSALGFYPVAGSDRYELGAPLFPKAEVALGPHRLVILAEHHAPNSALPGEVWLNGTRLDRTWIRHEEIARGGVLRFVLPSDEAVRSP